MNAGAVLTHRDAEVDAGPVWIWSAAVHARAVTALHIVDTGQHRVVSQTLGNGLLQRFLPMAELAVVVKLKAVEEE